MPRSRGECSTPGGKSIISAAPGQAADHFAPAPASKEAPRRVTIIATAASILACLVALPIVLALGGPLNGWVLGTALWVANWAVQLFTAKHAMKMGQTAAVGVTGISLIIRAWTVAGVLFITALRFDETVALVGAAVFLAAFTADLLGRAIAFAAREKANAPAGEDAE
ncbi:MAG: hypothetical protein ACPGN4_01005 [Miltoncostaeaceae bacterium]